MCRASTLLLDRHERAGQQHWRALDGALLVAIATSVAAALPSAAGGMT
jgi:hypothetical protein